MPVLLLFIAYLCVALLFTALLFYPVFQAIDAFRELGPDRVFDRLAMIIAALGFWPFLKLLGINNRNALGYSLDLRHFLQTFSRGLGIGVMIMSGHAMLLILLGARVPVPGGMHLNDVVYALLTGLLSGILVAFIEETFFRGAMHYGMRRQSSMLTATITTALLYAAVHFIHAPVPAKGTMTGWQSGWEMLAAMFHSYENFAGIVDSYTALFAAGLFLSMVRERTGNIALCIGIHAGWVLTIRLVKEVTDAATDTPAAFLIGSYDDVIGWAAVAVLTLVTLWYWRYGYARRLADK
jgi:membrane protease YdiL (CAAX protease family)